MSGINEQGPIIVVHGPHNNDEKVLVTVNLPMTLAQLYKLVERKLDRPIERMKLSGPSTEMIPSFRHRLDAPINENILQKIYNGTYHLSYVPQTSLVRRTDSSSPYTKTIDVTISKNKIQRVIQNLVAQRDVLTASIASLSQVLESL